MIRITKLLVLCATSILALNALAAESRVVNLVECKLVGDKTVEDVHEANGRWVRYMNKTVAGGDIQSFVVTTAVGDWTSFKFIDSFPNMAAWAATSDVEAAAGDEISSILEDLNKVSACSGNTLHRSRASE